MKKWLCILLTLIMLVSMTACDSNKVEQSEKPEDNSVATEQLVVKEGIPTYEDDIQIELSAYCGPRRAGYRNFNNSLGSHPDDPAGGWEGWITEKDFQDYMDCGFTYLMSEYDAIYDTTVPFEGSRFKLLHLKKEESCSPAYHRDTL